MTKPQRTLIDDLIEAGRRIVEELDGLLNPDKKRMKTPAPVPVPVRKNPNRRSPNR